MVIIFGILCFGVIIIVVFYFGFICEVVVCFLFLMLILIIVLVGSYFGLKLVISGEFVYSGFLLIGIIILFISVYICIYFFLKFIFCMGMILFVIYCLVFGVGLFVFLLI